MVPSSFAAVCMYCVWTLVSSAEAVVTVPQGGASGGHILQFRQPNAVLSGTLTIDNASSGGPVFVWAWSEDDSFTQGVFTTTLNGNQASGSYRLDVLTGTTWHVGARFDTGSQYWRGEATIAVNSSSARQDLLLTGPNPKPGPVAVLFDAADEQTITLADGTEIFIPAGAMPVTGEVLLRIIPISAMPTQMDMRVVDYGYAFLASDETGAPITEHFNQDVTIRFTYDDTGVLERWLRPAYYSTTTDEWTVPESYVVDTAANEISMQIDHFTNFALLDTAPNYVTGGAVLTYTFSAGREGWLVLGDANGGSKVADHIAVPHHAAIGGHPGGYLYAVDDVTGDTWFWLRRFTDTLDASAAYSRTLRFDLRQTDLSSQYRYPPGDVILEGGAAATTTLSYHLPYHPRLFWTPYEVLLHESARWIARSAPLYLPRPATAADFQTVLGNLRSIRIRGEYRDGADIGSLDNVILGGEPRPSRRVVVSPSAGGRLVFTTSTTTTLNFPPGMSSQPFTITVTLTDTTAITRVRTITGSTFLPPQGDFWPVGHVFIIEARRPNGSLLLNFNRPFTITVHYSPDEIRSLQEASLRLYYRGTMTDTWRAITSTRGANVLSAVVDHLTQFVVLGETKSTYSLYLPLILR